MANLYKGKFFFCLLFIFAYQSLFVSSSSAPIQQHHEHDHTPCQEPEPESASLFDQQQVLLHKLEELVRNLSEIATKLDSKLSEKLGSKDEKHSVEDSRLTDIIDKRLVKEDEDELKIREGERWRPVSVTKYNQLWSERFQFVSAVKLDSIATSINILPFRDYEGHTKYVAVGDEKGRVYVFLRNGDVLVEYYTMSDSPISSMLSYMSVFMNESVVVTGHRNGLILVHRIWEGSNGEDWNLLHLENLGKFEPTEIGEDVSAAITTLEVHHVGRMRYILSTDLSGKIRVFRENGTLYGSAMPKSRPLAFLKQRLLFLTETGVGSLDLRTMKVRESQCEGLDHSVVRNYVFDATERSKAYGFTSKGDLIHVMMLGDIINFKCRVRSKRKSDMDWPLALQAIKGYLIIVNEEKVFVYNVSSQHYARVDAPKPLFAAGLDEMRSSFLNYQEIQEGAESERVIPIVASDREKLVVLGLGGGYVGVYRSNLPVLKVEFNTLLWTSPVLIFIVFLFGAWKFFAKKKEDLRSWGSDDPFSSTSIVSGNGDRSFAAPLVSGNGDRSLADSSSRSSDIMDIRGGGGGLSCPPRRYGSPSSYPRRGNSSFRPSSNEVSSRPASIDPNFGTSSELKFRRRSPI